jgi:hypothetical protein
MNIWLVHYSRTGASAQLADVAAEVLLTAGHRVCRSAVIAQPELPYPLWLALSFIPHLPYPVAVKPPTLAPLQGCVLVTPKWTLNCPPVAGFLKRWADRLPPTMPLVTCGGWDQERYLQVLERRLDRLSVTLRQGLWVKRGNVDTLETLEALEMLVTKYWGGPGEERDGQEAPES